MKNSNRLIYIIIISSITLFTSCDDFLEKKPLDAISDADVWSDVYLAEAYLNNVYRNLYDGFSRRNDSWCYGCYMLDAGSDDGKASYTWTEAESLNLSNFTSNNAPLQYSWGDLYQQVRRTNLFLSRIDAVNGDEELKNRLKGEAKFLRAWIYFDLMKQYGGVPLITDVQESTDELLVRRSTFDEGVEFLVSELNEAAQLLPLQAPAPGRATEGAALGLKSRVLLYWASPLNNPSNDASRWAAAAQAAKDVIDLGQYNLYPDFANLFQPEAENNVEVIFDKQYKYPINGHPYNTMMTPYSKGNFQSGWGGTSITQEFVDAVEMQDGKTYTESPLYDPQDPYKDRDPRFDATVFYDGQNTFLSNQEVTIETRVQGDNGIKGNQDATKTGYYLAKFLDRNYEVTYTRDGGYDGEQNWIYIRYAEILLNYAEAQNEAAGPDGTVYDAVNAVRARVSMPELPQGLSKDQMRERIRNERRVELAFEEHRFWDIRRWKIAEEVLNRPVHGVEITVDANGNRTFNRFEVETRSFPEKNYLFPIIQSEVFKSNGVLSQNPGW